MRDAQYPFIPTDANALVSALNNLLAERSDLLAASPGAGGTGRERPR